MGLEAEIKEQEIEVLTPEQSAEALLGYTNLTSTMNLTEVNSWLVIKYGCDRDDPETIWEFDEDTQCGVGFVNSPTETLEVGIYFKHPEWREGRICRANNQIDLMVFLNIATNLKNREEKEIIK